MELETPCVVIREVDSKKHLSQGEAYNPNTFNDPGYEIWYYETPERGDYLGFARSLDEAAWPYMDTDDRVYVIPKREDVDPETGDIENPESN